MEELSWLAQSDSVKTHCPEAACTFLHISLQLSEQSFEPRHQPILAPGSHPAQSDEDLTMLLHDRIITRHPLPLKDRD